MEIFSGLEEKNLFLIKRCQDAEQQLEEKKHQEKSYKSEKSKEIDVLKVNERLNFNRIEKLANERDALKNITEENESTKLDAKTQEQLQTEIIKMYKVAKEIKSKDDKGSYDSSSILGLIEETENILNKFYEDFNFIKNSFPDEFKYCAKELKTQMRNAFRDKNEL